MSAGTGVARSPKPENIIWLGTMFWDFPSDFYNYYPGGYYNSGLAVVPYVAEKFYLEIGKTGTSATVSLIRRLVDPQIRPDIGFNLEVCFTLIGSEQSPVVKVMKEWDDEVNVTYDLDLIKSKKSGPWIMKCSIMMMEYFSIQNPAFTRHNSMLRRLTDKMYCYDRCLVARLLGHACIVVVFSGRQNDLFAQHKCLLVERTLPFWIDLVVKYVNLKQKKFYGTRTLPSEYLSYIAKGYKTDVDPKMLTDLYSCSFGLGIPFLQTECREFMLKNLNTENIVYYLEVADHVQDDKLMNVLLDAFIYKKHAIMDSENWKRLVRENLHAVESILDAAKRREKSNDCKVNTEERN